MKVLAHPDPFVLETALLAGIRAARSSDPLAPVLVVVPTSRLAAHVRRRLAQTSGACLAVDVLPHRALTLRAAATLGGVRRRLASPLLLRVLMDRALSTLSDNTWEQFVRRRPGARTALLAAATDLREAGVTPLEFSRATAGLSAEAEALADVYAAYVNELRDAAPGGLRDETALVAEVLDTLVGEAQRHVAIFHHGAYELIGIHLDLIRALDRAASMTFLLPCEPGAHAYRYAEMFARRHLLAENEELTRLQMDTADDGQDTTPATALLASRLAAMGDEDAQLPPLDPPLDARRVQFLSVQGATAEANAALRQAVHGVAEGVEAEEIAIVARDLGTYIAALETAFAADGLPWTSSAGRPLLGDPTVADLVALFDLVARDYPRAATAEWLASPRVDWSGILPGRPRPALARADTWSRQAGLLGGLAEWTDNLPAWARAVDNRQPARATAQVDGVGRAVAALHALLQPERPRRWSAHADLVESVLTHLFAWRDDEPATPSRQRLYEMLADMRALETTAGDGRDVTIGEMAAWLREATAQSVVRTHDDDIGGFRLLDVRQARGLIFRQTHVLGLQAGSFPRPPREDAVLRDDLRVRLRQMTARPLPTAAEAEQEEDLLLALTLGSARDRLYLSWQHADDAGRTVSPSLALREVARITLGRASLAAAEDAADKCSGHPKHSLAAALVNPGVLAPRDLRVLIALRCDSPEATARALLPGAPELGAGLAMLTATESFSSRVLDYDGRAGTTGVPPVHSATRLQDLGNCPLRYFFRTVLRVAEPEPDVAADQIEPRLLGTEVHRLLQHLYQRLADESRLETGAVTARDGALALFDDLWPAAIEQLTGRRAARLPVLWDVLQERWRVAVRSFIAEDVHWMTREGWRPGEFEQMRQQTLELGDDIRMDVRGQFDRVLHRGTDRLVGDYKTGQIESARRAGDITKMLKATTLQVPIYHLLAGDETAVELLPLALADGGVTDETRRLTFDGFENTEQATGFLETLRVLAGLLDTGRFPIHPGKQCARCHHALACRKDHPPSREREAEARDTLDFRDTKHKNKSKRPTLATVRVARDAGGDGDEETG